VRREEEEDPLGHKLLQVEDPLGQAAKLLRPLEDLGSTDQEVWLVSSDVALRRKSYLQAVRGVKIAHSLDARNPDLHWRLINLRVASNTWPDGDAKRLSELAIDKLIPQDVPIALFNSEYLQKHPDDARVILSASKANRILGMEIDFQEHWRMGSRGSFRLDIATAHEVLEDLQKQGAHETFKWFSGYCHEVFPLCCSFASTDDIENTPHTSLTNGICDKGSYETLF